MSGLLEKVIEEEHHLADVARDGYAPATMPIVLGGIVLALVVVVGLMLAVSMIAYYSV